MISKQTITFLKEIKKHNNKVWFEKHKDEYKAAHAEFSEFIDELAKEIAKFDDRIKKALIDKRTIKVFRIYRDARFSKDKSPYKTNLGGYVSPGGMEGGIPGYYVHIEPGNSFVGGGLYMPESKILTKVRAAIAKDDKKLRKILQNPEFKKTFKELGEYDMLKTVPKGFPKDHPAADLLRFKSFTAGKEVSEKDILSQNFQKHTVEAFKVLKILNDYLADVIQE